MDDSAFILKLGTHWAQKKFVAVALDPDFDKLPSSIKESRSSIEDAVFKFNQEIIDATADLVLGYKPNSAFYEALGDEGQRALERTITYLQDNYPELVTILDAKRADIGNTNSGYVTAIFDELNMDAVTVHPYLGKESLKPFLERKDKGVIILAKTSNPGSGEFQDLPIEGEPLYLRVAKNVANSWNENGNCGLVVGATYPKEIAMVRAAVHDLPLLIPGIGAQGGDASEIVSVAKNSRNAGMIFTAGRSIIFASNGEDFAESARRECEKLSETIQSAL
jgi:orotidine-5'-phosphate decarboxylase